MISLSPDWQERIQPESRWRRWFLRAPVVRVDRNRWRLAYPVTFLTAPAGLRQVRLVEQSGLGELVLVQVRINVYSGQWRQLTVGPQTIRPGRYPAPPVADERGVDVNTAARLNRRRAVVGLLVFLVGVAVITVLTCGRFLWWP